MNFNQKTFRKNILKAILLLLINSIPGIPVITYSILILKSTKGVINSIKSFFISFILYFLNPGIWQTNIPIVSVMRWIIFFIMIYQIVTNINFNLFNKKWIITLCLWGVYTFIISLFNSTLPIISCMRLCLFLLGFILINLGIKYTSTNIKWEIWIYPYFVSIILLSSPLIFSPVGYFRNQSGFQGITSHPNTFGIMLAIIIVTLVYFKSIKEFSLEKKKLNILLSIAMVMIFLTKSRTSIFSILLVSPIFFINIFLKILKGKKIKKKNILMFCIVITVLIVGALFNYSTISNYLNNIVYKGNEGDILYSSKSIYEHEIKSFLHNPLLGNGFGVRWIHNQTQSFSFSSIPTVEKRNIFISLLSETGIIGTTMFVCSLALFIGVPFRRGLKLQDSIFLCILCLNFGELFLYSANGLGGFAWIILGFYHLQNDKNNHRGEIENESIIYY